MYIYAEDKKNTASSAIIDNRQVQSEKPVSVRPVTDSLKTSLNYELQTAPAFFAPSPALFNSCAPIQRGKGKKKRIAAKKKGKQAASKATDTSSSDAEDTGVTDEEDQVKEITYDYDSVCALYEKIIGDGSIDEFKDVLSTTREDVEFYQLLTEVIQNDSDWVKSQNIHAFIGICNEINLESYETYGNAILSATHSIRLNLVDSDNNYRPFIGLFMEDWFTGTAEENFFSADIKNLLKIEISSTVFQPLLESPEAADFISHAPTLSSWLDGSLIKAVINIGCTTLVTLNGLYPSAANHKIPILAHFLTGKLPPDKIIEFFQECHNLGLNEDSIERVLLVNPPKKYGEFLVKKSEILTMLDKNRSFPQWIHVLNNLLEQEAVKLERGQTKTLEGEPLTIETVIYISDLTTQPATIAGEFVIHAHPGVGKANIQNPYRSACHLKPVRSGDVRLDEDSVPEKLKNQLDGIFRELKKKL